MEIDELTALVPPPPRVCDAVELQPWKKIGDAIGIQLPTDYRSLALRYGTGRFEDEMYQFALINPLAPAYQSVLLDELSLWEARADPESERFPAPLFPAVPGLLPWGDDIDGGMMGWLAGGDPSAWPIILVGGRGNRVVELFEMSLTAFLVRVFSRQIESQVIAVAQGFAADVRQVVFRPHWR